MNLEKIDRDNKEIVFKVSCSKGTYIRTLCENIAEKLGTIGYMKELGMNTCWNKAHLFAQAMVEGGKSLDLKTGEGMNYAVQALPDNFSAFSTTGKRYGPPNELAFRYGRVDKKNIEMLILNED